MSGSDSSGSGFRLRRSSQVSSSSLQRLGGRGDLIEDIHRQHRRRVLKRAAQFVALAVALLLVGVGFKVFADRRARSETLDNARTHLMLGMVDELAIAVKILDLGLERSPRDSSLRSLRALTLGHAWLEFGGDESAAREALGDVGLDDAARAVADAMLAFGDGELDAAADALSNMDDVSAQSASLRREALWMEGLVAVARQSHRGADPEPASVGPLVVARDRLASWVAEHDDDIALRRMLATLQLHAGEHDAALTTLAAVREDSTAHMGLAADDALYHAVVRDKLAGVASVADQLLESDSIGLSRTDRAHAVLARAVVHAHSGEQRQALARLDEAWEDLPSWNGLDRRLAIETALEAGDTTRVQTWAREAALPDSEIAIYLAWGVLLQGDVMGALAELAKLPQAHPRVAYLQALALVEQGRFSEAQPWLTRAESLLPGRIEIEVARARSELRLGTHATALSKLEALAEFEPYAPRAWTGLGEAHWLAEPRDLEQSKRALLRAVDREPRPAEALLLLGRIAMLGKGTTPGAQVEALRRFERAAETNASLPKYGEALALHLAELGLLGRAAESLQAQVGRPGVGYAVPLALIEVGRRAPEPDLSALRRWLEQAQERKAPADAVTRAAARIALLSGDEPSVLEARSAIGALLAKKPADVATAALQVRLLLALKDKKAAETTLRRGLAAAAEDDRGRLFFEWARMESRTGKRRVAAPRSRRAWVELLGEDRSAWELIDAADLSVGLWLRGNKERIALAIATKLTERLDYHSEAWTIRARAELAYGDTKAARASADKAIGLDSDNPRAHEVQGHCLLRFGYRDQAKTAYERAVALVVGTPREKSFRANLKRL